MGLIPIAMSYTFKLVLDNLILEKNPAGIISASLLGYFAFRYIITLGNDLLEVYQGWYFQGVNQMKIQNYLNYSTSEKISSLDIDHFENSDTQNLINRAAGRSVSEIQRYIEHLSSALSATVTFISSFIVLVSFNWWIPLVLTAVIIPRIFITNHRVKNIWSAWKERVPKQRELSYLIGILQSKESVREIRLFSSREELLTRVDAMQTHLMEHTLIPIRKYLKRAPIPIILETITIFILIYLKLPATIIGTISIGTLTFYIQNADRILASAGNLQGRISRLSEMNLYTADYFELMELPQLVKERDPGHEFDLIAPPYIEFQNVSFSYLPDTPVLKKISFKLSPGERLAIVGPNGSGKSTLVKLLLRFYDPTSGRILINDLDLKDLRLRNWYKFVGTLFQDFSHYLISVKDNIRLGNPELVDSERMVEAAKKSGAHEFIEKLPGKYDQKLGRRFEDSVEISAGQWQKLALARAFYEEAPVLILDEPTSAIDAETEAEIFDNLNKTYKDKTLIFVSHRFSTVRNANKIIVLKDGAIAEEGTHKSLMGHNGIYARMFRKQAKGYIE